jgi:hypothetical protein
MTSSSSSSAKSGASQRIRVPDAMGAIAKTPIPAVGDCRCSKRPDGVGTAVGAMFFQGTRRLDEEEKNEVTPIA